MAFAVQPSTGWAAEEPLEEPLETAIVLPNGEQWDWQPYGEQLPVSTWSDHPNQGPAGNAYAAPEPAPPAPAPPQIPFGVYGHHVQGLLHTLSFIPGDSADPPPHSNAPESSLPDPAWWSEGDNDSLPDLIDTSESEWEGDSWTSSELATPPEATDPPAAAHADPPQEHGPQEHFLPLPALPTDLPEIVLPPVAAHTTNWSALWAQAGAWPVPPLQQLGLSASDLTWIAEFQEEFDQIQWPQPFPQWLQDQIDSTPAAYQAIISEYSQGDDYAEDSDVD